MKLYCKKTNIYVRNDRSFNVIKNGGFKYIAEFFVMPKYRKGYFSINVIKEILRQTPGNIEIKVLKNNIKAYKLYSLLINRLFGPLGSLVTCSFFHLTNA